MPNERSDAEEIAAAISNAERETIRRKIANLDQQLAEAKANGKYLAKRLELAEQAVDFATRFDDMRDPVAWEKAARQNGTLNYCPIVQASDWHLGEVIEKEKVNGKNEFNPAIANRRVKKFFTKIPEYVERYTPKAKLLVMHAGGDFIGGYIHEELVENNSCSPGEECEWFAEIWSDGLAYLRKKLPAMLIWIVTSPGNHGRTTLKKRITTAAENSFEQLTYKMLASKWSIWDSDKKIRWQIGKGYHSKIELFGLPVRMHHGDHIKYAGGVGGISIPIRKAIAQWNKADRVVLDLFGHHHEHLNLWDAVVNGCLCGYGPFSVAIKAPYQPPTQTFNVFDAKHGLRFPIPIFVDD